MSTENGGGGDNGEKRRKTGSDSFEKTSKSDKTVETHKISTEQPQFLSFVDDMNYVINGNDNLIEHKGSGRVTVHGNVQSLILCGTGSIDVYGNVARTIDMSGRGNIRVFGNVGDQISGSGMGSITVVGTHNGDWEPNICGLVDFKILTREEYLQQFGKPEEDEENDEADGRESDVDEEENESEDD